jgi:peptidoglycan lytic transglycosylase
MTPRGCRAAPGGIAAELGWLAATCVAILLAVGCASTPPTPPAATTAVPPRGAEPYTVKGRTYVPERDPQGYKEEGMASWYGAHHQGRRTASGERFNAYHGRTAAHKTLPFDTCVRVEVLDSGRSVTVRINDRGPFAKNRLIDLSRAAAKEIGLLDAGVARVRVEAIGMADHGRCPSA